MPKPTATTCGVHAIEPSCAPCHWCARGMCEACFRFVVGGRSACVLCAREIGTRRRRRASLAVVVALGGMGGAFMLHRQGVMADLGLALPPAVAVVTLVLGVVIATSGRLGDAQLDVVARDPAAAVPTSETHLAHPFRALGRRVVASASPSISASLTALVLAVAMALSAATIPAALHWPRWLEIESVLGVSFAALSSALAVVLYRGARLDDDYRFVAPHMPWQGVEPDVATADTAPPARRRASRSSALDGCGSGCDPGCGDVGFGGLAFVGAVLFAAASFVLIAWVTVEVSLPLVFFAFYQALMLAIRRALRDRHGCEGRLARSLAWGAAWAALYLAPVALLVWVLHETMHHGRG